MGEILKIPESEIEKVRKGAEQAVRVCGAVRKNEKVVIVQDEQSQPVAKYLAEQVEQVGAKLKVVNIGDFGDRPLGNKQGAEVVREISGSDAAFVCTNYLQPELKTFLIPIQKLIKYDPVRLALMFDLDLDLRLMTQGMNADYYRVRQFTRKVLSILEDAKQIRVTTERGTDFTSEFGLKWVPYDGFPEPGRSVNLPDGEVLTSPTNVNGRVVVDGVVEEFGDPRFGILTDTPISMKVENGRIILDSVQCLDRELRKFVVENLALDENSNRIGEWAMGTNRFLKKLIGNLSQDEKFPSVHFAPGYPYPDKTGANWTSNQHMDMVIPGATVDVDGQIIMEKGKYLI